MQRCFADDKKPNMDDLTPPKLPTSETNTAPTAPVASPLDAEITASTIDGRSVPQEPPAFTGQAVSPAAVKAPLKPQPVVKKKGFFRRLRNYLLTLTLLGALGFGGLCSAIT